MELQHLQRKLNAVSDAVHFLLDGEVVTLRDVDPTRTVLQYLREDKLRCGTKEGCAEGDCGACTVVVAELNDDKSRLRYRAINSCIQFVPTLDGKELITVESLAGDDSSLHPVQRALVECHGSQCGFCTPGFVMSLFAMYKTQSRPARNEIDQALAGNLCRCTGYRPIVDAAVKMYDYGDAVGANDQNWMNCSFSSAEADPVGTGEMTTIEALKSLGRNKTMHIQKGPKQFFAPVRLSDFAALAEQYPEACLLAGGTDVGLWVTKQYKDLQTILYTGNVRELLETRTTKDHIEFGAAVTLTDTMPVLTKHYPELEELFVRFASPPIRNAGTLGGNIANGSPIGDSMPALIVIGTTIVLRKGASTREMALDEYYLDYQKTAQQPGEFVERIRIPKPRKNQSVRSYKLSKRFDQDISAVCGAYAVTLSGSRVDQIRIAYGGLAAIPKRAFECESSLSGGEWDEQSVNAAMEVLGGEFSPIADMRASREYRQLATKNLLYRFFLETTGIGEATNVYKYGRE